MEQENKAEQSCAPKSTIRRLESRRFFEGDSEVIILHGEGEYRLRVTKSNKLILTK